MKYGFVYIWYDRKHKRYYIGSHWGHKDDGYICSSRWMRNAYKRRPQDFRRKILTQVDSQRGDLLAEEYRWLQMISKDELGKKYYNLTNHMNGHWSSDAEKANIIRKNHSQKMKEKYQDPEYKAKVTSSQKPMTQDVKDKLSKMYKGKKRINYTPSTETRAKISENTKRLQLEKKIGMHGRIHSEYTKQKMSANNAMHNPEYRERARLAKSGTVGLWLNSQKKYAKPGTELFDTLIASGYKTKEML